MPKARPASHRPVVGLEADQTPGRFDQRVTQARVAVFGHRTEPARASAGMFAGTQARVAGDLTTVGKTRPIADFPVDDFTAQSPQPNRLRPLRGLLHRLRSEEHTS